MTFTNTASSASCDTCGTVVAKSWRAKAAHICPRTVADPFARTCPQCQRPFSRGHNESAPTFNKRRYCGRTCAGLARRALNLARKENQP